MNKIIIAIDGYSSCGKSTMAKEMAKKLNYIYIDTGAMYRAITLFALRNNLIANNSVNEIGLVAVLPNVKVKFNYNSTNNKSETFLNDVNIESEIRGLEVSNHVSKIALRSIVVSRVSWIQLFRYKQTNKHFGDKETFIES